MRKITKNGVVEEVLGLEETVMKLVYMNGDLHYHYLAFDRQLGGPA